jgi:hypothetical protein
MLVIIAAPSLVFSFWGLKDISYTNMHLQIYENCSLYKTKPHIFSHGNVIPLSAKNRNRFIKRVPGSAKEKDPFTKVTNSKRILHQHYK